MNEVLRGVKVVELAQWWLAPSATALLGEWGAEVVKVEHPTYGDPIRGLTTSGTMPGEFGVNFMLEQSNHGKRSIGLDIVSPEGRRPELVNDDRFATAADRATNLAACMAEIEATFATRSLAEWRERLAGIEGVWSVVQTATELVEDPQVVANGYVAEVDYGEQRHRLVTGPSQFDGRPSTLRPAPGAGEHTDEILLELGRDMDEIIDLKVAGVIT